MFLLYKPSTIFTLTKWQSMSKYFGLSWKIGCTAIFIIALLSKYKMICKFTSIQNSLKNPFNHTNLATVVALLLNCATLCFLTSKNHCIAQFHYITYYRSPGFHTSSPIWDATNSEHFLLGINSPRPTIPFIHLTTLSTNSLWDCLGECIYCLSTWNTKAMTSLFIVTYNILSTILWYLPQSSSGVSSLFVFFQVH